MSTLSRFKFQRAIPVADEQHTPDYYRFNLPAMRQLSATITNMTSGTGPTAAASCFVPASSWATGKSIIFRMGFSKVVPLGCAPSPAIITTNILMSGAVNAAVGSGLSMNLTAGTWYNYLEFKLIREGSSVLLLDMSNAYFNFGLSTNAPFQAFQPLAPFMGPFDFSVENIISLMVTIPFSAPSWSLNGLWVQGLMESGTNLGTLA